MLASIPSPPDNAISLGPFELRAYGLAIAIGVLVAVAIGQRRWAREGGDPADISAIAVWAVLAGLVGARLYHVITDWRRFEGRWHHAFAIWEGGLGIPGGLVAGVLVGVWVGRRRGLSGLALLDMAAPAIPVAQAIGRLGNYFNQELFGRPTDLPWGLEIDPEHRPARYATAGTFHPTFLYEALWNLALAGALVLFERRRPGGRPGRLFALYVLGYALGRLWVEALRADPASELLGVRVNIWTSLVAALAALTWLVLVGRHPVPAPTPTPASSTADGGAEEPAEPADAEATAAETAADPGAAAAIDEPSREPGARPGADTADEADDAGEPGGPNADDAAADAADAGAAADGAPEAGVADEQDADAAAEPADPTDDEAVDASGGERGANQGS
ncbi:MAG TPA: prolipoprotein diacylglyceryl transferase [Acidimicrobiales bacterium]